jgi:hypothetical protein
MLPAEKVLMAVLLFGGYFWLRARARALNLANQQGKVVVGVFVVLTGLLMGEKAFFDHWHFGLYTDLLLRVAMAAASFAFVGLVFLKPGKAGAEEEDAGDGTQGAAPRESKGP